MTRKNDVALLKISFPDGLKELMEIGQTKKCDLELSGNGTLEIILHSMHTYDHFSLILPVKDILEILKLDLPSWAIKEKIVKEEKIVEKTVEVLPKFEKCSHCGKSLSDLPELFVITLDKKSFASFCSDECHKKWLSIVEGELKK